VVARGTALRAHEDRHVRRARRGVFAGERFYKCVTIEDDSDANAETSATRTLRRVRCLAPHMGDRVIRWTPQDGREERRELIQLALGHRARNAAA
jgi:hypothetical protein